MLTFKPLVLSLLLCCAVAAYADEPVKAKQSLIDIYQLALIKDPTLASSQSALQASQELITQAKALHLPTVTAIANTSVILNQIFAILAQVMCLEMAVMSRLTTMVMALM